MFLNIELLELFRSKFPPLCFNIIDRCLWQESLTMMCGTLPFAV